MNGQLRDYQQKTVEWMMERNGGILDISMGLGKTITSLEYIRQRRNQGPSLVICSKTVLTEWVKQTKQFYDERLKIFVLHNDFNNIKSVGKDDLMKYDIVLTTYHTVMNANKRINFSSRYIFKDTDEYNLEFWCCRDNTGLIYPYLLRGAVSIFNIKWNVLIVDECHTISNWRTQLFRAIYSLSSLVRFGLSGTPVKNKREEFITLLKFLNEPHIPSRCSQWQHTDPSSSNFEAIRSISYEDANIKLPNIHHYDIPVHLSSDGRKFYQGYFDTFESLFNFSQNANDIEVLALIMKLFCRLRQICLDPYLLTSTEDSKFEMDGICSVFEIPEPIEFKNEKEEQIIQICRKVIERREKVIIFCSFTTFLRQLNKKLGQTLGYATFIASEDCIQDRMAKILDWQTNPNNNILIMNYRIGSEGLNLIQANNVILADTWWNFSLESQAVARCYRTGQTRDVNVYRLLMKDTIEDLILEKCISKKDILSKLKSGEKFEITTINKNRLLQLLDLMRTNANTLIN